MAVPLGLVNLSYRCRFNNNHVSYAGDFLEVLPISGDRLDFMENNSI